MAITASGHFVRKTVQHNPKKCQQPSQQPPFLRLPVELRLQIYAYLIPPSPPSYSFQIRTLLPTQLKLHRCKHRTKYQVPTTTGLYSSSITTSYYLHNAPGSGSPSEETFQSAKLQPLYPEILAVCRLTYTEARPLLYLNRTFDFGKDIPAIVPFFNDLLPSTRRMITSISLTKSASWRAKDFDEAVWRHTCEYLADNCSIQKIKLRVVTAKVQETGNGAAVTMPTHKYSAGDFRTLMDVGYEGLEWVRDFLLLSRRWQPSDNPGGGRWYLPGWGQDHSAAGTNGEGKRREGLKELVVEEEVEHCPRIDGRSSGAMAFYGTFSRSVGGFERFLRSEMLDEVDDWGRKVG